MLNEEKLSAWLFENNILTEPLDILSQKDYLLGDVLQLGSFKQKVFPKVVSVSCYQGCDIISNLDNLAIDAESFDIVFAPFVPNLFKNKQLFLAEVDRILKPEGYFITTGINPLSLFNILKNLGLIENQLFAHSAISLNSYFFKNNYQQILLKNFCYLPYNLKSSARDKINFFAKFIIPMPANFFLYIVQKQIFKATLNLAC